MPVDPVMRNPNHDVRLVIHQRSKQRKAGYSTCLSMHHFILTAGSYKRRVFVGGGEVGVRGSPRKSLKGWLRIGVTGSGWFCMEWSGHD
ncbi:hypothetical protein AVEN_164552-1 [Araneus ventricosus]|uniref:Uncharacterized protein n=1 Tax=Araneus ventricosus TaxID=182803 RepID=A0A4Y2B207_ARAVE|nr:hypothetical protein AVEN_164552-1 [Araneus ventricosus]